MKMPTKPYNIRNWYFALCSSKCLLILINGFVVKNTSMYVLKKKMHILKISEKQHVSAIRGHHHTTGMTHFKITHGFSFFIPISRLGTTVLTVGRACSTHLRAMCAQCVLHLHEHSVLHTVLVGLSYPIEWWAFLQCKCTTLSYTVDRH